MKSFVFVGTLGLWLVICSAVTVGDASTSDRPTIEPAQPEVVTAKSRSEDPALQVAHLATTRIELSTPENKRWESLDLSSRVSSRPGRARVHSRAGSTEADRVVVEKAEVKGGCGPECDSCWIGTEFENDCLPEWEDDGECDCGCQFPDTSDCFGPTGACCNPFIPSNECILDTLSDACLSSGGAYMGDWSTCISANCAHRCDYLGEPCDYCWLDTQYVMACPLGWEGDGDCDCGVDATWLTNTRK